MDTVACQRCLCSTGSGTGELIAALEGTCIGAFAMVKNTGYSAPDRIARRTLGRMLLRAGHANRQGFERLEPWIFSTNHESAL